MIYPLRREIFRQDRLSIIVALLLGMKDLHAHTLPGRTVDCKSKFDKRIAAYVYLKPTKFPSFPGGNSAWIRFLNKKFQYPQQETDNGNVQTRAVATFTVDSTGLLHGIGIKGKKEIEWTPFEKAFIKVVSESGLWEPPECHGRRVSAYFEQPIQIEVET